MNSLVNSNVAFVLQRYLHQLTIFLINKKKKKNLIITSNNIKPINHSSAKLINTLNEK